MSDLPDPDEIPDLPDDVVQVTAPATEPAAAPAGSAAPATSAATAPTADGEPPPLRVLDKAPAHLRKAALLVIVGGLLPFMGHHGGWMTFAAAKVLVLIGVWFWFKQIQHNYGPGLGGVLGKLGNLALVPKKKEEEKPKRRRKPSDAPTAIQHPFPTALHVLSLVVVIVGCVALPVSDPTEGLVLMSALAELGMLAWAAYTWVHIYSYERWGAFNPIFPLMFLGIVFAGVTRVLFGFGAGLDNVTGLAAVLGGGVVAIGGGLAAWTIVEALMQAKKEGDLKKQAAAEARRAARKSRR